MLYLLAKKLRDGSVEIMRPNEFGTPATHWLFIDKYNSSKPDYRHKSITLNCYKYPLFWIR